MMTTESEVMTMDDAKRAKLHAAIDAAKGYGQCRYVDNGAPCCVIAQLAHLEGVPVETLARWGRWQYGEKVKTPLLDDYDQALLRELQATWDGRNGDYIDLSTGAPAVRVRMHRMVDDAP